MASPDKQARHWAAGRIAQREARRRATEFGKVAAIVVITIMATLVFTGHRMTPDCVRAIICLERGAR